MLNKLFEYNDEDLYIHHAFDKHPVATDYTMHAHGFCEILGFIRGKAKYVIEGHEYKMKPGSLILTRPSEVHRMYADESEPYERIMVNFPPDLFLNIDPENKLMQPFYGRPLGACNMYYAKDFPSISGMSLLREMVRPAESTREKRLNLFSNLIPLLNELRIAFEANRNSSNETLRRSSSQQIIDYINDNLHDNLTLETLSDRFFISRSQLSRVFKTETGTSVMEYVSIKRLMLARELLAAGETAGNVSRMCGFDDYSTFFRAYKRRFGASPSDSKHIKISP